MKSLALNSDVDSRWGIERWKNEGGRIRFGTTVSNGLNRPPADHWTRNLSHNFGEAGLSVWSDAPTNFLLGSKEEGRDMKENKYAAVLLGPPGSGKTTLVRSLTAVNRISVIETGNLLKREVRLQTPLGRQLKPYTDSGDLVPSEWVEEVISAHLASVHGELGSPTPKARICVDSEAST